MFIRSSTAINDCLIALDCIKSIIKEGHKRIDVTFKDGEVFSWGYEDIDARDKAFDELCEFLNTSYKLRDFT